MVWFICEALLYLVRIVVYNYRFYIADIFTPCFCPCPVSQTVRLYDAKENNPLAKFDSKGPSLDCCFTQSDGSILAGGLDRTLRCFDVTSGDTAQPTVLGYHEKPIRCVDSSPSMVRTCFFCYCLLTLHAYILMCLLNKDVVYTGSWDASVKQWDPRSPGGSTESIAVPERVYTMSVGKTLLAVGCAGCHILIYDQRELSRPLVKRESSLKYQIRCVRLMPDETGFTASSVAGKVAVEYINESAGTKYGFRCHRQGKGDGETVYPVNTLAYHPLGTFASGGCEGTVCIWDAQNKKRLASFSGYPDSIASLSFNASGDLLAIASSYTFEDGERPHSSDAIYVRPISDSDVKPRPRKPAN